MYENSDSVYLTDGGHIENLGVYELLRRRCKVIIAVDAEADAPMNFGSSMTLQRYARIDLGVRIDLPWTPIRECTRALMARNADKAGDPAAPDEHDEAARDRVHVAIGTIDYGGDDQGYLVYVKSSLNGDENDYIRDYARRNDRFPHETTGDQFFSEEQFEVYRALGFHMAHGFLSGRQSGGRSVPGTAPRSEPMRIHPRRASRRSAPCARQVSRPCGTAATESERHRRDDRSGLSGARRRISRQSEFQMT